MQLLQCTASLPGGSGHCNSCNALPHCLGAVGSATPAIHCCTVWGQWTVQLLRRTASLPGGSGQWNSRNALPHCLGVVGSATPAIHCRNVSGQWTVQLLQCTAPLPGGSGQCNSCDALPHCLGAVGSATPATHCLTAWGQWTVQLLQCTAPLPGGSGQCNSCNTLPHRLGAVDSATSAMHCPTAWGQWAMQLLQCTASLPGGSGQRNFCNGWSECPAGPVGMYYPAHQPGGEGESTPGGGRGILQGLRGAIIFGEPGAPARGGWAVQPRGWSEPPARPMGSQHPSRTGRTGLGGTGSPAQRVAGVFFRAHGEASSSENRAHGPGGDGESSPGGVRSLLQGPRGAILF